MNSKEEDTGAYCKTEFELLDMIAVKFSHSVTFCVIAWKNMKSRPASLKFLFFSVFISAHSDLEVEIVSSVLNGFLNAQTRGLRSFVQR